MRIIPVNYKDTYGPSDQIQFELPSNTLVDLDSLHIDFRVETSDGNTARLPADIHKLIRRVQVSAGGQDLGYAYDEFARLKNGMDGLTGRKCHPMSHPEIVRGGLDPSAPTALSPAAVARQAAIDTAKADLPTTYSETTAHLHLTAPLDGGANGTTPVDGSINIIGKHSSTKLSVVGFDSSNVQVMTSTAFTWTQLSTVLESDGALLVDLFDLLAFTNYSVTQSVADDLAAKRQAVADAEAVVPFVSETAANMDNNNKFIWNQFGGFLETAQPRQIDLSILPTLIITIHLAEVTALTTSVNDNNTQNFVAPAPSKAGSFSITRPELYITSIGFGNSAYDQYVSSVLSKRQIEIPFRNYRHYYRGDFDSTTDFSFSTRSLDRIHFQTTPTDLVTQNPTPVSVLGLGVGPDTNPGEKYVSSFYVSSSDGIGVAADLSEQFQFQVNGTAMPSFPMDHTGWYVTSTDAVAEMKNPWSTGQTVAEWANVCCHRVLRLNRPGSSVQSCSGLDTRNTLCESSLFHFPGQFSRNWQGCAVHIWVECSSLVRVLPNRNLEIIV